MTSNSTVVPLCQSDAIDDPADSHPEARRSRCWPRRADWPSRPNWPPATGHSAFWKAIDEVSPTTRHQRCTVHKTANVLDKLPKSVQPAAKADLREIWTAPDRATAGTAITTFAEK